MRRGRLPAQDTAKPGNRMLSSAQLCAETGTAFRQLYYWMQAGMIEPDIRDKAGLTFWWEPEKVEVVEDLWDRIEDCPYKHARRESR